MVEVTPENTSKPTTDNVVAPIIAEKSEPVAIDVPKPEVKDQTDVSPTVVSDVIVPKPADPEQTSSTITQDIQ